MKKSHAPSTFFFVFPTDWGPCGLSWNAEGITGLELPDQAETQVVARLAARFPAITRKTPTGPISKAVKLIQAYFQERPVDFSEVKLALECPPFHRKAYESLRTVGRGKTVTYRELAELAGSPQASRAVGQAMAKNPIPLIVPCHRVLGAGNRLTGFSSPGGTDTKIRMLRLEGVDLKSDGSEAKAFRPPFDMREAESHLRKSDRVLGKMIDKVGPCLLELKNLHSPFEALLEAIAGQQLAAGAATAILARIRRLSSHSGYPTPKEILDFSPERLRGAGLSGAKMAAFKDLAAKTIDGTVPTLKQLARMSDDRIIDRLTVIRGIGRWTVEMMLIFRLGRPDVLAVNDYGLRKGYSITFGTPQLPTLKEFHNHGERWRPFRTVASWYLWRANEISGKRLDVPG